MVTAYYLKAFENNKGKYSLGYQHIINRYYVVTYNTKTYNLLGI